ncbi:aminoglycoside resistance protein [Mycolicibacterium sp. CH28]|uniref:aminoglycoside phosphotransferase family protein n=1 Tax=Mycolicibacterium sp. CH28 TaxID=2512237 RepID=UPI0010822FAD|nr:aminoglycoside phosphotransferase family protein [Mycolicibacterium sp. CH28]TGD84513.1 aminoglycoside resistance protein [Mycolicibacterium sp. CH28]
MTELPAGVRAMAARGPDWASWVAALPQLTRAVLAQWQLRPDGPAVHGYCSLVLPERTPGGAAAVLKIGFPDDESEHEHLALRRWAGNGAVRLLSADSHRRALLLERLRPEDLTALTDVEACVVVAGLYRRIHVPAMPQLRALPSYVERWAGELATLPRSAPIPHRLVEQAITAAADLTADRAALAVVHGDLHYGNVLGADREPWLVIDPKPVNGDPHYEIAPMLWNRFDELAGDVREGVRRRFYTLVDAAGFDEDRARAWVIVRMVINAMWALTDGPQTDKDWLTTCIAVAKAVQD